MTPKERNSLRWYLEEYWKWPYYEFAQRGQEVERLLTEIGKRLYRAVFGSPQAVSILQFWRLQQLQPGSQRQLSIISDIPNVLSLPWELLHDEQGFLALRTRQPISIVRRLPQGELVAFPTPFQPPLRILLVTARPEGAGFMDPRGVARELLDEVDEQINIGAIALEFLRPPTLTALRNRLKDTTKPVHILHFDGHGIFEAQAVSQDGLSKSGGGQGMLAFEDKDGKLDLVKAKTLAQVLQDSDVKLAVLDACQSAMGSSEDAFSSVATRLIQGGVDAAVAMSASVLVASTTIYFEAFYRELAGGAPASIAQERGRQALHDDPRRHISRRRKDEEGSPVELQDWWLPHFYQQRPLELHPGRPSGQLDAIPAPSTTRLSEGMPAQPRYGFTGRAYELLQIERHLLHGKLVVIHGFGGNGKTTLARETADWLTRTHMYEGACFVSFEHGGDSASLLSALGTYLGVYDGNYNPNDSKAALARLQPVLKQKHILLIADNLESILPGGEAPLDASVRSHLLTTLLELNSMGAGILLTSRDTAFGDGRLAPGKQVAYLPLAGLHPEDAYTLASTLLNDLGIARARAPYAELHELLKQLDYHPLAIQLVLPALRELSLTQIHTDFAALLPKFTDDTETGRNRSLLASLDYSLRRLTQEQRALLPRLALFEGGASEDDLIAITGIPETEWANLRPALEQAALLTAEQVHEALKYPFLRFHPVLVPYLRSQLGADDPALRERYTQRYYALASYLYDEDNRNPQPVRALVRRELPNLRRALELLLESGKLDEATEMAYGIAHFLGNFGLLRERDELRKRVDKAVADASSQKEGALTYAEYLRESGLGEDEYSKGHLRAAYARFMNLLVRIEALPEGTSLGRGSYEHCLTLLRLARCLRHGGQSAAAEEQLRLALAIIEALIQKQPDDQNYIRQRGTLLADLGDTLRDQGRYIQAQNAYEEALNVAKQQGELRPQAVVLTQLGTLALKQRDYNQARSRYTDALEIFQKLGEPSMQAVAWHQLGIVAQEQKEWAEAERCYRESLAIRESLGNIVGAAQICNQLANVSRLAGRPNEAEGWYKRALELYEQVQSLSREQASVLTNLAALLKDEVRANRASRDRLIEAKKYSEQALTIDEKFDISVEIWKDYSILAQIADLEGRTEEARNYRRRERETYAAFEGNRYHIDRQAGQLIAAIVDATKGDEQAQKAVEKALPGLEEDGWDIADVTRRIWAGSRDWHLLVEDLDRASALLVLRVLETIAQSENAGGSETEGRTPEEVIAALPVAIREAMERGDEVAFRQAFDGLSAEEQQMVVEAMLYLQGQAEEGEGDEGEDKEDQAQSQVSDMAKVMQQFEPLLQLIAGAVGDASHRNEIEKVLDDLETKGWHLKGAVQRIWVGERDVVVLTAGLDVQDAALMRRMLEIIGGQESETGR